MTRKIKNANSKEIGIIQIEKDYILIQNDSKNDLLIDDSALIERIKQKDTSAIVILYDDYTLTIAEIATLFEVNYHVISNMLCTLPIKTNKKSGRRNSSYNKKFNVERCNHISQSLSGKHYDHSYERTSEILTKLSNSVHENHLNGVYGDEWRKKLSDAWKRGCYKNSPMGTGYSGYFYSVKNNKDYYFRSLLELYFYLNLEQDDSVQKYDVEPFQIKLSDKSHYTPDVLIDEKVLVELKNHSLSFDKDSTRFKKEIEVANKYCEEHCIEFKLIFDTDIGFSTYKFKSYLKSNNEIINQYNIRFQKCWY